MGHFDRPRLQLSHPDSSWLSGSYAALAVVATLLRAQRPGRPRQLVLPLVLFVGDEVRVLVSHTVAAKCLRAWGVN